MGFKEELENLLNELFGYNYYKYLISKIIVFVILFGFDWIFYVGKNTF